MLEPKIILNDEDYRMMELMGDSICLADTLFSSVDNLTSFSEDKFVETRLGQFPLLSHEYGLALEGTNLSEQEKMEMRSNCGSIYCLAARAFGKTVFVSRIDTCLYILFAVNEPCGFSSFDMGHLRGAIEPIVKAFESHPILKHFIASITRSPGYYISTKLGTTIESINMNVACGTKAGDQFQRHHVKRLIVDEASKESDVVYEKRQDSVSPVGAVYRISGMTDITEMSPAGKQYYDVDNRKKGRVLNLPQYCNRDFNLKQHEKAIIKYGGQQSFGFRIFVEGEIVQNADSAIDMQRVRDLCYPRKANGELDETNTIKSYELNKKNFCFYESRLIVERPSNADQIIVASDVSDVGITEITIWAQINKKWRYLYNITLRGLTNVEQEPIFKFLYKRLKSPYMAFDSSDGAGRSIVNNLEQDPNIENTKLIRVAFHDNIEVGYVLDDDGKPKRDEKHQLIKRFEKMKFWAHERFCHLAYNGFLFMPLDYKFDEQAQKVVSIVRSDGIAFICIAREDHIWQSIEVFSIAEFLIEFAGFSTPESEVQKRHCKTGV
jgi:hypothetical protein